ncbi:MAG: SET domain-containing protein-lysine N-methyltransferase [Lewinellaceae bacterium]|nr:SET domain-containing protein-lysine N-methyltransferase [Saprospiraceae bacterium]MCB9338625.1 SET domain-containing protein-lysine N-methyltransferase [Lewinellaceae bacterium]
MAQRVPFLYITQSDLGGRGVFTGEPLDEGDLIEISPVIVLPEAELSIIHNTFLHDYYFLWGEAQKQCAIALGYGSLYNHSYEPNARYLLDYEHGTIDFYCIKKIEAGEEITVNYNGEPDVKTPVWFDKDEPRKKP